MSHEQDFITYMDGIDVKEVAAAARRLDATSFFRNQMSHADFQASISRTDEELFAEREKHRLEDQRKREEAAILKLRALRDALGDL